MSRLAELQPWLRPWAEQLVQLYPPARVTSVYRTWSQQYYLYRRFLAGQNPLPVAPPGRSYHQYRRAFDLEAPSDVLQQLGDVWESWGGRYGGRFQDPVHFEA